MLETQTMADSEHQDVLNVKGRHGEVLTQK